MTNVYIAICVRHYSYQIVEVLFKYRKLFLFYAAFLIEITDEVVEDVVFHLYFIISVIF